MVLLTTATMLSACVVAPTTGPAPRARPVNIPYGHVHHEHCGHFRVHETWYHLPGHRHGPGCGHVWRDGHWESLR